VSAEALTALLVALAGSVGLVGALVVAVLAVVVAGLLGLALVKGLRATGEAMDEALTDVTTAMREASEREDARWDDAAAAFGWTHRRRTMVGEIAGTPAILQRLDGPRTELNVGAPLGGRLQLRRRVFRLISRDEQVGDAAFDEAVDVDVDAAGRTWLTQPLRAHVLAHDYTVAVGPDSWSLTWSTRPEPEDMPSRAAVGEEVARLLTAEPASVRRQRLITDRSEPAVLRARAIDDAHEAGETVTPTLLDDEDDRVRRAAAEAVGAHDVLLALADDPATDDEVRQRATAGLARAGDPRAPRALQSLFASDTRANWFMGVRIAQRIRCPGLSPALTQLAARGLLTTDDAWSARLASATALACKHQADPVAEPLLLALLGDERERVSAHAAEALGACGSLDALPALRARLEALGVLSTERAAVKRAVAAIRSRLGGEVGGLAIAEAAPAVGAVSVVAPQQGQLSHADSDGDRAD